METRNKSAWTHQIHTKSTPNFHQIHIQFHNMFGRQRVIGLHHLQMELPLVLSEKVDLGEPITS